MGGHGHILFLKIDHWLVGGEVGIHWKITCVTNFEISPQNL
jgi:hypothetical protein